MAGIREIIDMCKDGEVQSAYEQAIADMEVNPTDAWEQRKVGWALYYLIKQDTERTNFADLLAHLDEFKQLDLLSIPQDNIIFDNILFKIAGFVKASGMATAMDGQARLSTLFEKLRSYDFEPSKGYSYLLQCFIKCDVWQEMVDFIEWWDLDKLMPDDYAPFRMQNGKSIMSLAEQAYIAMSKALLRQNDLGRIEEFLPKLDNLMENHPEMTYPGYFYGKLLLSLGNNTNEALKVLLPFARKKSSEFWVWQLLSDVFAQDEEKQLACLLRAVHCRTQESFLGKVRIKLAQLYIRMSQFDLAKYQIDKVTHLYLSQGWHLPYEVDEMIHQPWIHNVSSSDRVPMDYPSVTDAILCEGTEEAIAVVVHFDANAQKATFVYGWEKRMSQKLRFKVGAGAVLKINYITENDGRIRLLSASKANLPSDIDFAKVVEGIVRKREDKDFAFLKTVNGDFFISPNIVSKFHLSDGEQVQSLVIYDYNRKKETWGWTSISINKKNH